MLDQEAEHVKTMIEEYVETLSESEIIDIVINHLNDLYSREERFEIYNILDSTKSRYHGNWYWIIRRIRNTGALNRLNQ